MKAISPIQYLDYRAYLQAFYELKKKTVPRFSYTVWAEEFGFKSRDHIRLVIFGKRNLTSSTIDRVNRGLAHSKTESEYFKNLVNYNQAKSHVDRSHYLKSLLKNHKASSDYRLIDAYSYLSSAQIPRMHMYFGLNDVDHHPEAVAKSFAIPVDKVKKNIDLLTKANLIEQLPTGEVHVTQASVEVPNDCGNVALKSFYQKSFEELLNSIDLTPNDRHFQSATLVLSPEQYANLCQRLRDLALEITSQHDTTEGHGKRIYQLNLNLLAVSQPLIRKQELRVQEPTTDLIQEKSLC